MNYLAFLFPVLIKQISRSYFFWSVHAYMNLAGKVEICTLLPLELMLVPFMQVFAKRQIETITGNAWFSGSKQLEEMVCSNES